MATPLAALILVAATGAAIAAMLFIRRRAPEGSHFKDGDRAAGVFGVLATGFAILLGLIVVVAFTSYDDSRAGAEDEALAVVQQNETAFLLPPAVRGPLSDQLVCYARRVVGTQWPQLEKGEPTATINPWAIAMFRTFRTIEPRTASEQSAYDKWLDQRSDREAATNDRTHGAEGVIPSQLWVVLFIIAVIIVGFVLFFADSGEHALVQAMLMGSVVAVFSVTLLLIGSLDSPYKSDGGGLKPVAMKRALKTMERERALVGFAKRPLPCDAVGRPVAS